MIFYKGRLAGNVEISIKKGYGYADTAIGIVLSCIFSVFTLPLLMVLVGVV
jgi:hypothetical protein